MKDSKTKEKATEVDKNTSQQPSQIEMLGKAIDFLKNHVPSYGDLPYISQEGFHSLPEDKMDKLSPELGREINFASIAAAKFVALSFNKASAVQ